MAEESEDYAVKAAREWLGRKYGCPPDCVIEAHLGPVVELAAIIRKHVDENTANTIRRQLYCACPHLQGCQSENR